MFFLRHGQLYVSTCSFLCFVFSKKVQVDNSNIKAIKYWPTKLIKEVMSFTSEKNTY